MNHDFQLLVEAATCGANTVRYDNQGRPSILTPVPPLRYCDVLKGGSEDYLPCFLVKGRPVTIYVSKYQNVVEEGRAYSLPLRDPTVNLTLQEADRACRAKGPGWHLLTAGLWQAIALWCARNDTLPGGNTDYGGDWEYPQERGIPSYQRNGRVCRIQTGSGPARWNHNQREGGIADLNGNVWEWTAGLRLSCGEIQIIPEGRAMEADCDIGDEREWRAVLPGGEYVSPGRAGSFHLDADLYAKPSANPTDIIGTPRIRLSRSFASCPDGDCDEDLSLTACAMSELTAHTGPETPLSLLTCGLGVPPGYAGQDRLYVRNYGNRYAMRGGRWPHRETAGIFTMDLCSNAEHSHDDVGFRSAWMDPRALPR